MRGSGARRFGRLAHVKSKSKLANAGKPPTEQDRDCVRRTTRSALAWHDASEIQSPSPFPRAAAGASRTAALQDRDCVRRTSRSALESHGARRKFSAPRNSHVLRLVFDTAAFRTLGSKRRFTIFNALML